MLCVPGGISWDALWNLSRKPWGREEARCEAGEARDSAGVTTQEHGNVRLPSKGTSRQLRVRDRPGHQGSAVDSTGRRSDSSQVGRG